MTMRDLLFHSLLMLEVDIPAHNHQIKVNYIFMNQYLKPFAAAQMIKVENKNIKNKH